MSIELTVSSSAIQVLNPGDVTQNRKIKLRPDIAHVFLIPVESQTKHRTQNGVLV